MLRYNSSCLQHLRTTFIQNKRWPNFLAGRNVSKMHLILLNSVLPKLMKLINYKQLSFEKYSIWHWPLRLEKQENDLPLHRFKNVNARPSTNVCSKHSQLRTAWPAWILPRITPPQIVLGSIVRVLSITVDSFVYLVPEFNLKMAYSWDNRVSFVVRYLYGQYSQVVCTYTRFL